MFQVASQERAEDVLHAVALTGRRLFAPDRDLAVQEKYGFKAREFHAAGFANVAEYKKEHGSDLPIRDIDEYDRICKVTSRALPQLCINAGTRPSELQSAQTRQHNSVQAAVTCC